MSPERLRLAEAHRQTQIRERARVLRDAMAFWQTIDVDNFDESWRRTVDPVADLIRAGFDRSADIADAYYEGNRLLAGLAASDDVPEQVALKAERLLTSLRVTGPVAWRQAIGAGRTPSAAFDVMLVRQAGAAGRLVLDGGREQVIQRAASDPQATKFFRVTDGDPCAFCAMLAGRGAVYLSKGSANFQAHDNCACTAAPGFNSDPDQIARNEQFKQTYDEAVSSARADGELSRGTSNDLLNAFRRAYARG